MRAIDFFCGGGGLTCGLLRAGVNVLAGVDICEEYRETYQENNHIPFIAKNISQISQEDMLNVIPDIFDTDDVLFAGCAPCQPFSQQRNSPEEHKDRNLLTEFGILVAQYLPSYVVVENVPGIQKKGEDVFNNFLHVLDLNGYSHQCAVLNAKNYGVPQNRRRMVIVASRLTEPTIPPLTHISAEDIDHAIAVLDQSTLYGFSDARFTAMLGGLNYLRKNFSRAEEIFKEAERRKYPNGRKTYFDSKDMGISAEISAEVSYVGDSHSWLRTNDYPSLRCRTSKFNGVILQEKMRLQIHICFSPREAIAVIDKML